MRNKLFFLVLVILIFMLILLFLSDVKIVGYSLYGMNSSLFGG